MLSNQQAPIPGVEKIAVLRANALGDFIFSLPALQALRATYPLAEIVLLGLAWHADFLSGRPGPVDRVITLPPMCGISRPDWTDDENADSQTWNKFIGDLRQETFDLAIQMHGGGRYTNPFIRQIGARTSVGMKSRDAEPLDLWMPYLYWQPEILRFIELVSLVGAYPQQIEPHLNLTEADIEESRRVVPDDDRPIAVIHPGAGGPRRLWPVDKFAAVGDALAAEGMQIVLTGSAHDGERVEAVQAHMTAAAKNLCGKISLGGLAGLLSRCSVMVSNDSGPLHLAHAVGASTVGIYWCGNLINAEPITRMHHRPVIAWRLACPVCGRDTITDNCDHTASFVSDVTVEEVIQNAFDLLEADEYESRGEAFD